MSTLRDWVGWDDNAWSDDAWEVLTDQQTGGGAALPSFYLYDSSKPDRPASPVKTADARLGNTPVKAPGQGTPQLAPPPSALTQALVQRFIAQQVWLAQAANLSGLPSAESIAILPEVGAQPPTVAIDAGAASAARTRLHDDALALLLLLT